MVNQEIRDMPAQGSRVPQWARRPVGPVALPLTNAPAGQTPASSSRDRAPTPPRGGQAAGVMAPPFYAGAMSQRALRDQTTQERHAMDYLRVAGPLRAAADRPSYVIGPRPR